MNFLRGKFGYNKFVSRAIGGSFSHIVGRRRSYKSQNIRYIPLNIAPYSILHSTKRSLLKSSSINLSISRHYGLIIARVLRNVLKIRYLVIGGAITGGSALARTYEQWREALPDTSFLAKLVPSNEDFDSWRSNLIKFASQIKNSVPDFELDPKLKELSDSNYEQLKSWFKTRLDDAIRAAEEERFEGAPVFGDDITDLKPQALQFSSLGIAAEKERERAETLREKYELLQEELMSIQLKYQKEIEKLERENKELRKNLMLKTDVKSHSKKIKKSLIDMYSEVLDELCDYDTSYDTQDHLPRVVVVGDQSSGKTSVLEMIAQARIFPRGAGEMMTRAPVMVTLSEGPYHIAQFKDSTREFDLSKESELAELRREVELRMLNSVRSGRTVSNEVISMSVKGPGLQRMVLVDLPGIISTVTTDMAGDTREAIRNISEQYMSNPNSIILCIQDGSVDAERSNVTDLVSQMDPSGKRTIFVLTKVDLAEENLTNPDRISKILAGNLFPMKALGYFAVVTGRGSKDDSIQSIRDYEEKFFRNSRIFKGGVVNSHQCTTRNLSFAVSERFWKMVRDTVEQQADAFKATRFNLETEWKNNFPRIRELDRDELYEKARGEILDEVVNLSQVSPCQWEEALSNRLWDKVNTFVFENIYLPASQSDNPGSFNTTADIRLKQWTDQLLPKKCVEVGWLTLEQEFRNFLNKAKLSKNHDDVFDNLKSAVVDDAMQRHSWEDKAAEVLRVIQLNTLEDRAITDKAQWDSACKFLEDFVKEKLETTEKTLREMMGPNTKEQWLYWQYQSEEEKKRSFVRSEMEKILNSQYNHKITLSYDEVTTIRKNVQNIGFAVDNEFIRDTWHPVYRRHFLRKALSKAYDCRKAFYAYHKGLEGEMGVECSDIVLFWRLQQMIKVSANALRQQIMNREGRRLEREVKESLENIGCDKEKKIKLLTGRRVTLAEELKRVRQIQEKLEEFIHSLNNEK